MMKYILPTNPTYRKSKIFTFSVFNTYGLKLKKHCRSLLKDTQLYRTKIELDNKSITGINKYKTEIKIKYFGSWAFGVPGFKSKILFYPDRDFITIKIPDDDIPIVMDFINQLKEKLLIHG